MSNRYPLFLFTLPDTEGDTETNKNCLCRSVRTTQRQTPTQIPIWLCTHFICVSLGLEQCKSTTTPHYSPMTYPRRNYKCRVVVHPPLSTTVVVRTTLCAILFDDGGDVTGCDVRVRVLTLCVSSFCIPVSS